ncbi:hypothetical protein [Pasteuria penetrans]|uniref:hypothetical protein n=1 Tax=Pasteuria penetrans TaxID=86005 RepID=UPI000FA7CACF|nr:hypothetical protein [Pasteuria penetrans]
MYGIHGRGSQWGFMDRIRVVLYERWGRGPPKLAGGVRVSNHQCCCCKEQWW